MTHRHKYGLLLAASVYLTSCAVSGPQPLTPGLMPCPSDLGNIRLERDLTQPFATRIYLLDSGEVCKPESRNSIPMVAASKMSLSPSVSEGAEHSARGAYLRRFRGGQH